MIAFQLVEIYPDLLIGWMKMGFTKRPNIEAAANLRQKPPPPMNSVGVVWSSDYVLCLLVA